ncbi:MAG: HTTM domain-containing protein [Planctomycetota bacterium]
MVSSAPLAVFRVLFGLLMAAESFGAIGTGWVGRVFVEPRLTFPLIGFEPLRALSGSWMTWYFAAMGCAAIGVSLGWRYRASACALAALWTGAYLAQKTHYNNHYYLAVLVCWAMAVLPAHRRASFDVAAGRARRSDVCHGAIAAGFRVQVGIVFVCAALAKLYPGWLGGAYLAENLGAKGDLWLLGPLLVQGWFQTLVAYAAIAFDALVIPALAWRRTRVLAFAGLIGFDLFNSYVFRIGIFPYLVIAFCVFFFEPRAVERAFRWIPGMTARTSPEARAAAPMPRLVRAVVLVYFIAQLLLPLRHHAFPGDVNWTDEGHRMAWRMMLRTKTGSVNLVARDLSTGESWILDQSEWLTPRQRARVASRPEFLLQFVREVVRDRRARGLPEIEVRALGSSVSLNGEPSRPLYDPDVDLVRARWHPLGRSPWVLDRGPR